ncbi:coiled-coil domain-containing protein 73 isoform X3 [Ascaphus truei]|uniref:coiled-coil domain-containing protein 73 isoform X3 n=1 Tax=Ascaphus truei TaxID=8439 RepID=UPI003F5A71DE
MDEDGIKTETTSYTFQGSFETVLSFQLLEFKTSLFEAVEELRMGRVAKIQYEEQISKILMEKQELVWQNETLSHQSEILDKRHKEALAALKKQLQAKMCATEEEKGQFQLAAEIKEREIGGLKEDLKTLQMSKYSLQKKLHEMEQKAQLHMLAKEDHMKQLSEVEKCYTSITRQFGMVKEAHEKLQQNVQEAMQQNTKLRAENTERRSESDRLNEEVKKLTLDLIRANVACQQMAGEENISLVEKDQQLMELQQKLHMETEINKKLYEVNRNTTEEKQTLGRDNELQRAKAKENEEKFLALQRQHETALGTWKKQEEDMNLGTDAIRVELESIKEAYKHLQQSHSELSCQIRQDIENVQLIKNQEHQKVNEEEGKQCDMEYGKVENRPVHDPEVKMAEPDMEDCSLDAAIVQVNGKEMLSKEGNNKETVSNDVNGLQNVYNVRDKTSLCEEQKHESNLSRETANFVTAQENGKQTCKEKCSEDIPVDSACLNKNDACEEIYSQCSAGIPAQIFVESEKMLLDNNKPSAVCSGDASQQTDSNSHKFGDATSKVVYNIHDKADTTEHDKGVLINEPHKQESKLFPETRERLINKHISDKENSTAGSNTACLAQAASSYHSHVQKCSTLEFKTVSSYNDQNKQYETEQIQLVKENPTGLCTNLPPYKQTFTDEQNAITVDEADKSSEKRTIVSTFITDCKDSSNFPDVSCDTTNNTTCKKGMESKAFSPKQGSSAFPMSISPSYDSEELRKSIYLQVVPTADGQDSRKLENYNNVVGTTVNISHVDLEKTNPSENENSDTGRRNPSDINQTELYVEGHKVSGSQMLKQTNEQLNVKTDNFYVQKEAKEPFIYKPKENRKAAALEESCPTLLTLSGSKQNISANTESDSETLNGKEIIDVCGKLLARVNRSDTQTVKVFMDKLPFTPKDIHEYPSEIKPFLPNVMYQNVRTKAEQGSINMTQVADTLTAQNHPVPERDHSAEWNAVAQTLQNSSFPKEQAQLETARKLNLSVPYPKPCSSSGIPTGHNHELIQTPCEKQAKILPELPSVEEESPHSSLHDQINEIEKFLSYQRLRKPKKRKLEESTQTKDAKENFVS